MPSCQWTARVVMVASFGRQLGGVRGRPARRIPGSGKGGKAGNSEMPVPAEKFPLRPGIDPAIGTAKYPFPRRAHGVDAMLRLCVLLCALFCFTGCTAADKAQ